MAQFDVHRLANGLLVLDCQSDSVSHLSTRVSAPLLPRDEVPSAAPRLHPSFRIDGDELVLATHLISAIPLRELGKAVASLSEHRYVIVSALDVVITGV